MNEKDFEFDAITRFKDFKRMKYMGGMKNCFCSSLSKKELTFEIIHWELFCKTGVLRCVCVCVFV